MALRRRLIPLYEYNAREPRGMPVGARWTHSWMMDQPRNDSPWPYKSRRASELSDMGKFAQFVVDEANFSPTEDEVGDGWHDEFMDFQVGYKTRDEDGLAQGHVRISCFNCVSFVCDTVQTMCNTERYTTVLSTFSIVRPCRRLSFAAAGYTTFTRRLGDGPCARQRMMASYCS